MANLLSNLRMLLRFLKHTESRSHATAHRIKQNSRHFKRQTGSNNMKLAAERNPFQNNFLLMRCISAVRTLDVRAWERVKNTKEKKATPVLGPKINGNAQLTFWNTLSWPHVRTAPSPPWPPRTPCARSSWAHCIGASRRSPRATRPDGTWPKDLLGFESISARASSSSWHGS